MSWQALLLDFDGVVLESNDARTEGFRRLLAPYPPAAVARFLEHHRRNGGLSRYHKLERFLRVELGVEPAPGEVQRLATAFSAIVEDLVVASPWVPGARELLDASPWPLALVSGSDQAELRRIVARRSIADRFVEVLGSPATKPELIASLLAARGWDRRRVVYVGDSSNDQDAARAAGVRFVARAPGDAAWPAPGAPRVPDLRGLVQRLNSTLWTDA